LSQAADIPAVPRVRRNPTLLVQTLPARCGAAAEPSPASGRMALLPTRLSHPKPGGTEPRQRSRRCEGEEKAKEKHGPTQPRWVSPVLCLRAPRAPGELKIAWPFLAPCSGADGLCSISGFVFPRLLRRCSCVSRGWKMELKAGVRTAPERHISGFSFRVQ